jgi:ribosomal protein S14
MSERFHNPGREWLDRQAGHELGDPDQGAGDCDECQQPAAVRWTLGAFTLCRYCRRRRANAADREAA